MKKLVYIVLSFYCIIICVYTQTPSNDYNWEKNDSKSDEFNNATLDGSKWYANTTYYGKGIEHYRQDYVILDGNYLKLKTDKIGAEYWTGGISSKSPPGYYYGYYEISTTIPKGKGFWTTFWMWSQHTNTVTNELEWYEEIDILEPGGCQSINANKNTVGIWEKVPEINKYAEYVLEGLPDLSVSEHKFAVEWLPNYVVFYFDNIPFNKFCNHFSIPSHPMKVIINQQISGTPCEPDSETDNNLPEYFKVNWFRYHELKMDCNTIINQSNFNFNNYHHGVKKSITLKNTTVPQNSKISLRATDYIELQGAFEIPLGSEFTIAATPCYNSEDETCCLDNYKFTSNNVFNSGDEAVIQANDSIVVGGNYSDFIVKSGSNVTLKAGDVIILKPGFKAEEGCDFKAVIEPCE